MEQLCLIYSQPGKAKLCLQLLAYKPARCRHARLFLKAVLQSGTSQDTCMHESHEMVITSHTACMSGVLTPGPINELACGCAIALLSMPHDGLLTFAVCSCLSMYRRCEQP